MITEKEFQDLVMVAIDYPGKPKDVHIYVDRDTYNLVMYRDPTIQEFSQLAQMYVKKPLAIKDFYSRLKSIMDNAMRLNSVGIYARYQLQKRRKENKKLVLKKMQENTFKVLMPDQMNWQDSARRKNILKAFKNKHHSFVYQMEKERVLFLEKGKAKDFFAVSIQHPCVIKASFPMDKSMQELLSENSKIYSDFVEIGLLLSEFFQKTSQPYTTASWKNFWFNYIFQKIEKGIIAGTDFPVVMYIVDNARRFLFDALIQEHWQEIAPTKSEAQKKLKQNKDLIYAYAAQFHYIDNPKNYQTCEKLRNSVAHDRDDVQLVEKANKVIADVYMNFVYHFIDSEFLKRFYEEFPIMFAQSEANNLFNSYEVVRNSECISQAMDALLPKEMIERSTKEKLNYLQKQGLLSTHQKKEAEDLFLQRNPIAHGQIPNLGQQLTSSTHHLVPLWHYLLNQQSKTQ